MKFLLFTAILISEQVFAVPKIGFAGRNEITSDNLNKSTIEFGYDSDRYELFFPYLDEKEEGAYLGLHYLESQNKMLEFQNTIKKINFDYSVKKGKNAFLKFNMGEGFIEGIERGSIFLGLFETQLIVNEHYFTFKLKRDIFDLLPDRQKNLSWDTVFVSWLKYSSFFRFKFKIDHGIISDKNVMTRTDFEINIGKFDPWLWVGFGAEYLSYNSTVNEYWSPTRFWSYGFRGELNYSLSEKVSCLLGGSLNWIKEGVEGQVGLGSLFSTALRFGKRENLNLSIGIQQIKSVQNTSTWKSDEVFLNLNAFF